MPSSPNSRTVASTRGAASARSSASARSAGSSRTVLLYTYPLTILQDRPIRYYRSSATDSGSQAKDGTVHGGVTLAQTGLISGDTDTSALFNGSTGYISVPTTGLPSGGNWTMECWIKIPAIPQNGQD